jgi:hypothetical protein
VKEERGTITVSIFLLKKEKVKKNANSGGLNCRHNRR